MNISVSVVPILASCLLLAACAQRTPPGNDAMLYDLADKGAPLSPGIQPVRIGEGGPAFRACAAVGTVVNLSPAGEAYLALRSAPFAEGAEVARLGAGAQVYLCTRSLDQRWHGVVVPPDGSAPGSPEAECGVTAPLAAPRAYAGPCRSGWVASAFVSASAD